MQLFSIDLRGRQRVRQCFLAAVTLIIVVACGDKRESNIPTTQSSPATDYRLLLAQFEEELAVAEEVMVDSPSREATFRAAQLRTNVGLCLDAMERRDEAIVLLTEAADALRGLPETLDGKADTLGACADGLGLAYHGVGEHERARASFLEAIENRITAMNGMAAVSRIHLGNLYVSMSDYSKARTTLEQALAEAADPQTKILCHSALGRYFHAIGSYAEGLDHHGQAEIAAISEWGEESGQVAGIRSDQASALFRSGRWDEASRRYASVFDYYHAHGDLAGSAAVFNNLANVDLQRGDIESASAHFQKAIDLRIEAGRTNDPEILTSLAGLGYLHLRNHELNQAKMVLEEAELRALGLLGERHPLTIEIHQGLGHIALANGDRAAALKHADRAFASAKQLMQEALRTGSEEQQIAYRKKLDFLSLTCAIGDAELIAERLIETQGLVRGAKADGAAIAPITNTKETATAAYVRFIDYEDTGQWEAHYGAVIYRAGQRPEWCRLATDKQLTGLVGALFANMAFEQALDSGDEPPPPLRKLQPTLRRIYKLIWEPIADRLGPDVAHVAVCPEGIVSAIPFAALLDGERFLCEGPLPLSFFTMVRDVTSPAALRESGVSQAYGVATFANSQAEPELQFVPPYTRPLISACAAMGDLPGVELEIESLRQVFAKAGKRIETQTKLASEQELRERLRSPYILHVASHAFVLPEEPGELVGTRPALDRSSTLERTGLVVGSVDALIDNLNHGKFPDPAQDNILFTKEIAALELAETWLVTLSACSTGRGEQVSGEGVIGLQRGFFAAGAQHIAMTLWPLSDAYAPQFVGKFYAQVFATDRPDIAMWTAQREELVRLRESGERLGKAIWLAGPWTVSSQRRSW